MGGVRDGKGKRVHENGSGLFKSHPMLFEVDFRF